MLKRLAIVVSLVLWVSVPAFAGHYHGIRVTPTGIDPSSNVVDVYITAWMDTADDTYSESVTYVDWGDGEVDSETDFTLVFANETVTPQEWPGEETLYAYRGSFSHTYETAGVYTIKAVGTGGNEGEVYTGYMTTFQGYEGYPANTVVVDTSSSNVPTLPPTGLIVLALGLAGLGAILLRRTATS